MNAVFDITLPVFGIGILGYLAARMGWFSEQAAQGLARFVFDWAVPFLLVRAFVYADLPDTFPWQLLLSFYLPAYGVYALGVLVARVWFGRDLMGQIITGFGCSFGNSVLLGLPLTLLAFGDAGMVPLFILFSVHGLSYFTVTTVFLEIGRNQNAALTEMPRKVLQSLISNPIVLGLATGVSLNLLGWGLPPVLDKITAYMQQAVTPCALFSLGASLTKYGVVGQLRQSLFVVFMKNILLPALVWGFSVYVFELEPLWAMVATLLAAQATGVNVYLFAQRYDAAKALATTSVFLSTAISLISVTVLLSFFQ